MTDRPQPFAHPFDLASLAAGEKTVELKPSAQDRATIAAWAGVDALEAFKAAVRLRRVGDDLYSYEASFEADVVQSCVVTLVPVKSHLTGTAARHFRAVAPKARRHMADAPAAEDNEETETLNSGILDLAGPVLEELALAVDPYPRAPGAVFEAPPDPDAPLNPFSALEKLKGKG